MEGIENIHEVLQSIIENQKNLSEEIASIKASVMDELINPIKDEYEKMQYDNALSDFRCKYGEKLEPFEDKLKAIEGDDFDIVKQTFDDYSEDNKGYEEEEYVDEIVNKVNEQLNEISKAFGVEPEAIEEIKVETEEGEVEAKVDDGEVVEVEKEEEAPEEPEPVSEEEAPEVVESENIEEEKPEDLEEPEEGSEEYWEDIYNKEVKK